MSTLYELTIKYERLQEQQRNILKEIHICKYELQQYKKIQKTEQKAEINKLKNNEKNNIKILLSKQKLKHLNLLQESTYTTYRKDKIEALECKLLLTK